MKKLKTAVIGVGNMGRNHVRVLSEISHLVAIAEIDPVLGKEMSQQVKVPWYQDYREMITRHKIDAITVVVPTPFHTDVTIHCLRNKIPTLVEKPIAGIIQDARTMIETAKRNQTLLMVGHIERYNPAVIRLKKLIDTGKLGTIVSLVATRVGIHPPQTPQSDVVLDMGIHDVDVFQFLLEKDARHIQITRESLYPTQTCDAGSIFIEYPNTTGLIHVNWITPVKRRRLSVTGTLGFAELDYIKQELRLFEKQPIHAPSNEFQDFVSHSSGPKKSIFVSKQEPLKRELNTFLSHVKNGTISYPEHAYEALRIVLTK